MQIFIGNLNKMTTARQLADLFLPFGIVQACRIVSDRLTGHSMGCGVIEMGPVCGELAIRKLDHLLFMNSYMEISEVR